MDSIFEKHETHLPKYDPEDLTSEDCRFLLRALERGLLSLWYAHLEPKDHYPNTKIKWTASTHYLHEKEAFEQLMQVHRHVYVPEKLRRLLHDSEKDVHGRVDVAREKKGPPSTSNNKYLELCVMLEGHKVIKLMEDLKSKSKAETETAKPATRQYYYCTARLPRGQWCSSLVRVAGVSIMFLQLIHLFIIETAGPSQGTTKDPNEFSIHYTGGANVVVIDPEDQSTGKEAKVRKRKSKQDDMTCVCARVLPFIFECPPGQIKPPRGNPDKRTTKRSVHGFSTISSSTDGLLHGGGGYMHQS
uniref:Uncharacterized protein n=1 Tax=Ditylenchus dipsaci TaxID=166011 RepID=A0A915E375_9BILA